MSDVKEKVQEKVQDLVDVSKSRVAAIGARRPWVLIGFSLLVGFVVGVLVG